MESVSASNKKDIRKRTPEEKKEDESLQAAEEKKFEEVKEVIVGHREFGGAKGAIGLMIFSHSVLYYFWISQEFYSGALLYPKSIDDIGPFFGRMMGHIQDRAMPSTFAFSVYLGFLLFQVVLAFILPGIQV